MKKFKKKSIMLTGILLYLIILPPNVKGSFNNYYLIGGQEIPLIKDSYIIWKVYESYDFSFTYVETGNFFLESYTGIRAQENDKFKLTMYQDQYFKTAGVIAGDCLNGKLEFYDSSEDQWYTVLNLDNFLLYNYSNGKFYTSLLDSYGNRKSSGFGIKFLLFAIPMSIDFDTYANNTITMTNPSLYSGYSCTSNSINFTNSGNYNFMSFRSDGIVEQWIYNMSSQKIIVEYESHGIITHNFSYFELIPILILSFFGGLYCYNLIKKRKYKLDDIIEKEIESQ